MKKRFVATPSQNLTTEQAELQALIAESRNLSPQQALEGPFGPWTESPEMGQHLSRMGVFHRYNSCLNRQQIELAILVTAKFWQAKFEWWAHKPMAMAAGVPTDVIEAIHKGTLPIFPDARDAAVYHFVLELHEQHHLTTPIFERAAELLGQQGVIELVGLCGYYTTVSMTLNALEIGLPDGAEDPFPEPL
ncbi:MAG: carboxymuconolactone decarboxylase family protein [Pseudomonadales bacterium]